MLKVLLSTNLICINVSCGKNIEVTVGVKLATCMRHKRKMFVSECVDGFEGYINAKDLEEDYVFRLQTNLETFLKYFG